MAKWNKLPNRGNVQDRRGISGGGLGIVGVIAILGLTYLTGGDVLNTALQLGTQELSQNNLTEEQLAEFEGVDEYEEFASIVLGSLDEYWQSQYGNYSPATLVLFRNQTNSACGGAQSVIGPHYCPLDETIYLDETFFEQLKSRFGARGGDVAEAYVIAHEVGHHIQYLQDELDGRRDNERQVEIELTADCYAGAWAGSIADQGVFEPGEVIEALDAAAAVGDDNIQRRTTGTVQPDSFTHGSSQQRRNAYTLGYQNPDDPSMCLN